MTKLFILELSHRRFSGVAGEAALYKARKGITWARQGPF